jgi:ABC-type lipoprotein release transport system permease subunit
MLNDPWIAGATFIVLLLVSAIADFIPEHRASWIDPNPALR